MVPLLVASFFILASTSSLPQANLTQELKEARLITGSIINAIQSLSRRIQDAGLDPLIVDAAEEEHSVIPSFLELQAFVDSLRFTGLSNIAINTMDYSVLLNRLRIDISLPELNLSIGDSGVDVTLFGKIHQGRFNGRLSIKNIRISGEIRIHIGVISGISVRSLSLNFNLGGIDSQLKVNIRDRDYSDVINKIMIEVIPDIVKNNTPQINELLEKIAWEVIAMAL